MRKLHFSLKCCLIALFSIPYINMESIPASHEKTLSKKFFHTQKRYKTPIHKVQMTQRGYIQFLRWGVSVPEITEFTFCLWIKSTNTTYAQSFFSYSKGETDRLVRSWISPHGQSIFLEINNVEIFQLPFPIEEHRWYHLCQSWQSVDGRYGMWVDGRLATEGFAKEVIGHVIPSKGDIVVGQEFTDFDKGLEDGIEGSVVGFNLLLASAFSLPEANPTNVPAPITPPIIPASPGLIHIPNLYSELNGQFNFGAIGSIGKRSIQKRSSAVYQQNPFVLYKTSIQHEQLGQIPINQQSSESGKSTNLENIARQTIREAPLGLQLVIISHSHCEIGRGSPFIGGHLMLISWTRTPVRVFGGAIMKPVKSECGNF